MSNPSENATKRVAPPVADNVRALVDSRGVCVGCGLCGGHPAAPGPIQIGQSVPKKGDEAGR